MTTMLHLSHASRPPADTGILILPADQLGSLPPALADHLRTRLGGDGVATAPTLGLTDAAWVMVYTPATDPVAVRRLGGRCARAALTAGQTVRSAAIVWQGDAATATVFLEGFSQGLYAWRKHLPGPGPALATITLCGATPLAAAVERVAVTAEAIARCRDWVNTPAQDLGPDEFTDLARAVARESGLRFKVLDEAKCAKLGMGCLLAVGRASPRRPRMVVVSGPTARPGTPTRAWCGKGVCFDTGGLQIKPGSAMELMRKDMGGAATVLSALAAAGRLGCARGLTAWLPLVDNAIDGSAFRPGDVLTACDGTTVEVGHTDAEGRLILADALAQARKEGAGSLLTVATLTGAALTALGRIHVPLMGTDDGLVGAITAAAAQVGEKVWRLPLDDDHRALVKGSTAVLTNSGPGDAGCIAAGAFLAHFAGPTPFAHLDISPASWQVKPHDLGPAGATGVMVSTLLKLAESAGG